MANQPFNRPVTEEIPIPISAGSMLLGVTADKRFVAFSLDSFLPGGTSPVFPTPDQEELDELAYQSLAAAAKAATLEFTALAVEIPSEAIVDADQASYQELEALAIAATAQFNAEAVALAEAFAN